MSRLVTLLFAIIVLFACLLVDVRAQEKRQFFDSLGGMALGKRSLERDALVNTLAKILEEYPELRRSVYGIIKRGGKMQKRQRVVMDSLGGDFLMKRSV